MGQREAAVQLTMVAAALRGVFAAPAAAAAVLADLVAVSGIVIGETMTAAILTGRRLAEGLARRRDEIEAWLALGATSRQAVRDIARRGV
ncbi:ABC transporter permease [uncultured Jatrophihabitans sp.]|uniref:ABC transporter permease n=1 Tax=uncultured Jatrophihabitans sp. TaxID=1610747 RepID=UPI0035CA60C1